MAANPQDDLNRLHEIERLYGRALRAAIGLPDVGDRTKLDDTDRNGLATRTNLQNIIRKNFEDGSKIDYLDKITDEVMIDFAQRFENVSNLIRAALKTANLKTWQQLAKTTDMYAADAGGDYFVVEWRIKPARRDPQHNSCGCGCGCGCGG